MNVYLEPGGPLESHLEDFSERAQGVLRAVRCRLQRAGEAISAFSARKPAAAMGLALGMGVMVGWLVKRR